MSMREVAQLAGVSNSTVSRVNNDRPNVAAETVEAVRRAMRQLNVSPIGRGSGSPRAARGTRSATIAFLVFGTSGSRPAPSFEKLLRGVSAAAEEHGLSMVFSFVSDPAHLPPRIAERRVDGLLLHGERPSEDVQRQLQAMPTVWLMSNRQRPTWGDQVMPDNAAIGELAATYLLRRGHRHLAFLSAAGGSWGMEVRAVSFTKAAADFGDEAQAHVLEASDYRAGDLWRSDSLVSSADMMVEQLLALSPRPTGLFVAEDRLVPAVEASLSLHDVNATPGGDVELISCNNEQPHLLSLRTVPATIDIRAESIGRRGVEQLVWRLSRPQSSERIRAMVEPVLVEPALPAARPNIDVFPAKAEQLTP